MRPARLIQSGRSKPSAEDESRVDFCALDIPVGFRQNAWHIDVAKTNTAQNRSPTRDRVERFPPTNGTYRMQFGTGVTEFAIVSRIPIRISFFSLVSLQF